jgi:hypothetical protein
MKKGKKPRNQTDLTLRNLRAWKRRILAIEEQMRLLWANMSGIKIDIGGLYDRQPKRKRK